jgi:hypothetical protein
MNADTSIPTPSRFFRSRGELYGYVPGWNGEPVEIGERCVVYGLGQWREAVVVKVTKGYVYGQYRVASSDRWWVGKGSRTGINGTNLYVRPR